MQKATITAAIVIVSLAAWTGAVAQGQNIGLGRMERSEFTALKTMVHGTKSETSPAISTPAIGLEQFGMLAMTRADFERLREKINGQPAAIPTHRPARQPARMIDIGTGGMPDDEFMALKRMVAENAFFRLRR